MQTSLALEDSTPVADGTAADVARLSKKRRTLYRKLAFASLSLLLAGFVSSSPTRLDTARWR